MQRGAPPPFSFRYLAYVATGALLACNGSPAAPDGDDLADTLDIDQADGAGEAAAEIGLRAGLRYVYEGNVPGGEGEHTYCPTCRQVVIRRAGFTILDHRAHGGLCAHCGGPIDGVGL